MLCARIQKEIENGRLTEANLRNEQPRVQKEIAKLKEDIAERKMKPEDIRPGLRVQGAAVDSPSAAGSLSSRRTAIPSSCTGARTTACESR